MKLFYAPGACSLASHIILNELGVTFEYTKVDLRTHTTADGADYRMINPKGYVPALQLDNGIVLTENIAILTYLGELDMSKNLIPNHAQNPTKFYAYLEMLAFVSTEIHKSYGPLWNPNLPDDLKNATKEKLTKRYALIEATLVKNSYLLGDTFSVVDAYLFVVTRWATMHGVDLSAFPKLASFMSTVTALPSVQKSFSEEGLN